MATTAAASGFVIALKRSMRNFCSEVGCWTGFMPLGPPNIDAKHLENDPERHRGYEQHQHNRREEDVDTTLDRLELGGPLGERGGAFHALQPGAIYGPLQVRA